MKQAILSVVIFSLSLLSANALPEYYRYYLPTKENPFVISEVKKRPTADSVYVLKHNNVKILSENVNHYRYSANHLSDTTYNNSFSHYWINNYNSNDLIENYKYGQALFSQSESIITYKYDKQGRIIEHLTEDYKTEYSYNKESATSIGYVYSDLHNKWIPSLKLIYTYTANGYELKYYNFEDEENDFVEQPYKIDYAFDSEGRLLRTDHIFPDKISKGDRYEYSSDGYTRTTYSGEKLYMKECYTFNKNDDILKYEKYFTRGDVGKWHVEFIQEYTYYYSEPTSNQMVKSVEFEVRHTQNGINIITEKEGYFYIYNINGKLVDKVWVSNGYYIELSQGLYIIKFENISKKVFIK